MDAEDTNVKGYCTTRSGGTLDSTAGEADASFKMTAVAAARDAGKWRKGPVQDGIQIQGRCYWWEGWRAQVDVSSLIPGIGEQNSRD